MVAAESAGEKGESEVLDVVAAEPVVSTQARPEVRHGALVLQVARQKGLLLTQVEFCRVQQSAHIGQVG